MIFSKLIQKNWQIIIILFWASLVRFYRIHDLTTFSGDQGIDFLIVKRMIINGDFTLLGPKLGTFSDVAIIYLGPMYYYLISIPLLISTLDPIGPIIFISILSVLAIYFIYLIGLNLFNKSVAILSSLLYAFIPTIVDQSRVALNPSLIPFFSVVLFYALIRIIIGKKLNLIYPILIGISSGILFQLHYLTVSFIVISFLILIYYKYFKLFIVTFFSFLILILPQLFFEFRHNFFITNQIKLRILQGNDLISTGDIVDKVSNSYSLLLSIIPFENSPIVLLILFLFIFSYMNSSKSYKHLLKLLLLASGVGILTPLLTSFDPQLHYYAHVLPIIIILISYSLITFISIVKVQYIKNMMVILITLSLALNLSNLDLKRKEGYTMPKGWNLTGVKKASNIIANDVEITSSFNITATIDGDSRARPYRYLVESYGKIPLNVENYPQAQFLYLISRQSPSQINKTALWEVSSFRPFKFDKEWDIQNGIKLYKLSKEGK